MRVPFLIGSTAKSPCPAIRDGPTCTWIFIRSLIPCKHSPPSQAGIRVRPIHPCRRTHMSRLASLVHDEHMDGEWKYLALEMPCLKDEIQARGRNIVISSAHHRPVATNTGHKEWQDKALLQQSREDRIHCVLKCFSPVSHAVLLPLLCTQR